MELTVSITLAKRVHVTRLEIGRLDTAKAEDIEDQSDHVDKGDWGKLLGGLELELGNVDLGGEEGGGMEKDHCKNELIEKEKEGKVRGAIEDGLVSAWR